GAPLALIHRIDAVRGYSPLDVRHYREYLQLIANQDRPLRALDSIFTYPVIANFPRENRNLLDLLGVRYLLLPDDEEFPGRRWRGALARPNSEQVYDFLAGGLTDLGRYNVWENQDALPRSFVVLDAKPLPQRSHLLDTFRT